MSHRITVEVDGRNCIGLDIGDRWTHYHVEDARGALLDTGRLKTGVPDVTEFFEGLAPSRIALEVGQHSPWLWRLLTDLGHEVTVANAHRVALVSRNQRKQDGTDAKFLCWLLRANPNLLFPIRHRGLQARTDLLVLKTRTGLIRSRTSLISQVRGLVKQFGVQIPTMDASVFANRAREHLPAEAREVLGRMLQVIAHLTAEIKELDREVTRLCREEYPETGHLLQVKGVGEITALAFVLTIEDPTRFARRRDVGAYLGMVPRLRSSGGVDPELSITKAGDRELRWLLVQCAQHILGRRGRDSDLRRWGLDLASRGKKSAKKRAVVAVARKLAVLLLALWVKGEEYEPLQKEAVAA